MIDGTEMNEGEEILYESYAIICSQLFGNVLTDHQ